MKKTDRLSDYDKFSDKEVYESLCKVYPALLHYFDMLAQMQAFMGYSDEELLRAFRKTWPQESRAVWEEDNEFRGRLMLRGVHHLAEGLRSRQAASGRN
jgi:hypothetical protein